ncbi:hypothetical protein [Stutzerimonas nitrititolerans]|uniref:hypothetical protein n=1 Tax=Stutzerimonas nitrititolerans TaxID=2482751 RepID=UPI00289C93CA|nr:hypothetical protein [Stutzerimonas nitrititolerans]
MQTRIIDITAEIKLRIEQKPDNLGCNIDMIYQGPHGYEVAWVTDLQLAGDLGL